MVIDGATIRLRPPALADVDDWLAGEDDEIARWFEFPRRSTRDDVVRAIMRWNEAWQSGGAVRCWAICDRSTAALAGGVELRQFDPTDVHLSYWIVPSWRRRGLATQAARLALAYAAASMAASRAILKILDGNLASLALARRLGADLVDTVPSDAGGTFLVFHRRLP